jgi:hypothetical protein
MIKLIVSAITISLCSTIAFGHYFDRFGLPLFPLSTVSVLSQIAAFLVTCMLLSVPNVLRSVEKAAKNFTIGLFLYP